MSRYCKRDKGNFVVPCDGLQMIVDGSSHTLNRGVVEFNFVNMKTMKPTSRFYAIKTKENPKGLVLNYCPMCGRKIVPVRVEKRNSK